jgi:hypothetical protein
MTLEVRETIRADLVALEETYLRRNPGAQIQRAF